MKKLSIMASLLMGLVALSSCESDRDDNPTLIMPNGFTLLAPEVRMSLTWKTAHPYSSKLRLRQTIPSRQKRLTGWK